MTVNRTLRHPLLHAMAGLGVWAVAFVVLYGGLSLACRSPLATSHFGPISAVSATLIVLWLAHLGLLTVMVLRAWKDRHLETESSSLFMRRLTLFLHSTSWVSLVVLGAPVLLLKPCV